MATAPGLDVQYLTMARRTGRTHICDKNAARHRLADAEAYLEVAQVMISDEAGATTNVATGNAVLAAIAAGDAICCAVAGSRYRGPDHRGAIDYLRQVTGDAEPVGLLRQILDHKDQAHYGLNNVANSQAKAAIRKTAQLIDHARSYVT